MLSFRLALLHAVPALSELLRAARGAASPPAPLPRTGCCPCLCPGGSIVQGSILLPPDTDSEKKRRARERKRKNFLEETSARSGEMRGGVQGGQEGRVRLPCSPTSIHFKNCPPALASFSLLAFVARPCRRRRHQSHKMTYIRMAGLTLIGLVLLCAVSALTMVGLNLIYQLENAAQLAGNCSRLTQQARVLWDAWKAKGRRRGVGGKGGGGRGK